MRAPFASLPVLSYLQNPHKRLSGYKPPVCRTILVSRDGQEWQLPGKRPINGTKFGSPEQRKVVLYQYVKCWLGRQDSNLGSRDQNPLPYRLATPQYRKG